MTTSAMPSPDVPLDAIGLIAGNGQFPILFARAAKQRGVRVIATAMHGETEPALSNEVDAITWVRVGQLGKMIRAMKRAGIRHAAMAGGVRKTRLFGHAYPDLLGWRVLAQCVIRRDDGILRAIAGAFEQRGIRIVDSTLYMPDALTPVGVLTPRQPNAEQWRDLRYGMLIAREIGKLDIGQAVVVRDGTVLALEAIEGTDGCMLRAGALAHHRGGVVVKVAKPTQDMRFDVPAVGPQTITTMVAAGIDVLGLEAHRTLILEPETFMAAAIKHQRIVVGLDHGAGSDHGSA